MPQSEYGLIKAGSDFLHFEDNIAATTAASGIVWGTGYISVGGGLGFVSVNEGSLAWTIDEPGGILAFTTDTGDDDNACLLCGRFQPSNGGMWMETRFKFDGAATTFPAIYAGFAETMAFDTPVMPAEFATATMTYNGTGGMVGIQMDVDGTTDDFRALQGDAGAAGSGSTNGIRANETLTADEWYIARVEVHESGTSDIYMGHRGGLAGAMSLIRNFAKAGITRTDQFYAVCMAENRTAAARVFEVDYLFAENFRDWLVT